MAAAAAERQPICDWSDLPENQCAHCTGATLADPLPVRWEGTWTQARYAGSCAHCGRRFPEGDEIVQADINGDGLDDLGGGWCLLEHTRSELDGRHC